MKKIVVLLVMIMFAGAVVWAKDIYYCPMHPHYTSDRAGNCPICGMSLVKKVDAAVIDSKKSKDQVVGYSDITIDTSKQQLMGIRTVILERKPFVKTVRAVGYIVHDFELYQAQLEYIEAWQQYFAFRSRRNTSRESSKDWREYYITSSGQRTSEEFRKSQERFIKAEYELRHMGLSSAELNQLREIKYGRPWIQPNLIFFNSENPSYWVYVEIFESDLGFVDVGQKAIIEIPAFAEKSEGIVRTVAESVNSETRTVRVRVEIPNPKGELKEGMQVNVVMPVELNATIVAPRDAIMMTGTRAIAFIKVDKGSFSPREVQTGWESDGLIEIRKGLKEGQEIVSGANFLVDSESRMQAAFAGSAGE